MSTQGNDYSTHTKAHSNHKANLSLIFKVSNTAKIVTKNRYTKDQCFEEGGGIAGKALDLWLKKHKGKGREKTDKYRSANAIENEDKEENYEFLTLLAINTSDNTNDNVALAVTSGHNHEAYADHHLLA